MSNKHQGLLSIVAALLVLVTAMIDPSVSIMIATAALTFLGAYHYTRK